MNKPLIYCKGFVDVLYSAVPKFIVLTTLLLLSGLFNLSANTKFERSRLINTSNETLLKINSGVISPVESKQQITIRGIVVDPDGVPMPGVNITVEGTTIGVMSDVDGKYSIVVSDANAVLVFSFVGYLAEKVSVQGKSQIDVTLITDIKNLEEVVVVGYGTQKRVNVVGSVSSVAGDKLSIIPSVNVSNALSGLISGATITQTSGEPGQMSPRILIRGRTSNGKTDPLVVIDGVTGRSMDEIDPSDIESLSVLKDASAAIYGASAANGVILIQTKSGKEGKPRLNYQFYQGVLTPTKIPEVTNAAEYATMLSEYQVAQGKARTFSDTDIELFANGKDPWKHPNSDWYGDLIKKYTSTTRHNLSLDGGTKGTKYYISMGYKSDDAFYKANSTKYKQYNVRSKIDMDITSWLKTGIEVAGFFNNSIYPYKGAGDIVGQSTRLLPTQPDKWPSGEPGPDIEYGDNPIETSTMSGGKNDQKTYRLLSTFKATVDIPFIKGLSFTGSYNFDLTNKYQKKFFQPWTLYSADFTNATYGPDGYITSAPLIPQKKGLSTPENTERYERTYNQTVMINFDYVKSFGNHNISLFGGFEQYQNDYNDMESFRKYYISTVIQTFDAGSKTDQSIKGTRNLYARKSYMGRATYNYKSKYLAEFVIRADGSLKFPSSKKWGYFPAVLLGWRASEEGFWKNSIPFINYFKLRASYGQMGSDLNSESYEFMDKFGIGSGMVFGQKGAIETVVGLPSIANPFITWETQTSSNIGFDSKIMDDLFSLNLDVFYSKREDLLVARNASIPNFTGLSLPKENIGSFDNRGFEIEAGVHKSINKDLRIDFTANFGFSRNKIIFMDEPAKVVEWQNLTGRSYGIKDMYEAIGIFKDQAQVDATTAKMANAKPGDVIFKDVSGDGKIDSDDKILLDRTDAPETNYGANLTIIWKAFTFNVQIQGIGEYMRPTQNDNRRGEAGNYFKWQYDNRWTPTNTSTDIARAYNRNDLYWSPENNMSTYWYQNSAFCRLKNMSVYYAIPTRLYSKVGISKASIYVSGNNLALLYTANKIWDPEASDAGSYPLMKTFAIGANITF